MRLTRFTDIGLRALMYLGSHPGRTVSAHEIAERFRVSQDHVMKSLQRLVALGIVRGRRGRAGGFIMVRDPQTLRIGEVARGLEPSLALAECFEESSTCPLTDHCRLAGALADAQSAFFDSLDQTTVADLAGGDLVRLLELRGGRAGD
jgi:Rrf2 family nitric oxide-sensitive transcriptional repressor